MFLKSTQKCVFPCTSVAYVYTVNILAHLFVGCCYLRRGLRTPFAPWDCLASWFTHFTESCCDEGLIAFDSLRVAEKLVFWRSSCCGSASFQTKGWVAMLSKVCRQGLWRNATQQVWREGAIVWDLGLWAPGFLIMFISVLYPCESSARAQNGITSNITTKGY